MRGEHKMAMFRGQKKDGFDWTGALLGAFSPDAAALYNKRKDAREKTDIEAATRQRAFEYFKSQGYDDNAAMTLAMDPSVAANAVRDRTTIMTQPGYDPVKGTDVYVPTEHEVDGTIVRTGANGKSTAVYDSPYPKVIPGPDGSFMQQPRLGIGAINGGASLPGGDNLPRPQTEADVNALPDGAQFIAPDGSLRTKQGGAGQAGPRPFRFFGPR